MPSEQDNQQIHEINRAAQTLTDATKAVEQEQKIANEIINGLNSLEEYGFLQIQISRAITRPGAWVKLRRQSGTSSTSFQTTSSADLHRRLEEKLLPVIKQKLTEIIQESMEEQRRVMSEAAAAISFDATDNRTPRGVKIRKDNATEEKASGTGDR